MTATSCQASHNLTVSPPVGYETAALVTLASDGLAAGRVPLALTGQERKKHWDEDAECANDRYSYCAHALDCCIEDATPPGSP